MRVLQPFCLYCLKPATLLSGREVYPHRPDLAERNFWSCAACDAYVGCHKAGDWTLDAKGHKVYSDGTLPLGRLANAELREAKSGVHAVFDLLWQDSGNRYKARTAAYAWLAQELGVAVEECHIGAFNLDLCIRAEALASARLQKARVDATAMFA